MWLGKRRGKEYLPVAKGALTGLPSLDLKPSLVFLLLVEESVHCVISLQAFQFDLETKVVGTVGIDQRLLDADLSGFIELEEHMIKCLAPFIDSLFHGLFEGIDLGLFDQILDARRIQHDFECRHATSVHGRDEALR